MKPSQSDTYLPQLRRSGKNSSTKTIILKNHNLEIKSPFSMSPRLVYINSMPYHARVKETECILKKKLKLPIKNEFSSYNSSKLALSHDTSRIPRFRNEIKVIGRKLMGRAVNIKNFFNKKQHKVQKSSKESEGTQVTTIRLKDKIKLSGYKKSLKLDILDRENFNRTGSSAFSINPWRDLIE